MNHLIDNHGKYMEIKVILDSESLVEMEIISKAIFVPHTLP